MDPSPDARSTEKTTLVLLLESGLDYYELLDLFVEKQLSSDEIRVFLDYSPEPNRILPISNKNIRECIPQWNPSKYHSANISDIVTQMYTLLTSDREGITIFNSNNNPNAKKAVNNKYILFLFDHQKRLVDINRKRIYLFSNTTGG